MRCNRDGLLQLNRAQLRLLLKEVESYGQSHMA
jgi:hypothetical protein